MWVDNWRSRITELAQREWDLIIVGGGITGAGILLEASRRGLSAILIEQRDFAWGTSSRSSKLVHGGLRYLKEGRLFLTRTSVLEREALLQQAPGLVNPQSFAFADYRGKKPGRWMFALGLAIYDLLAGQKGRHYFSRDAFLQLAPNIASDELKGGMCYADAKTDDSRLVMRVLHDACDAGGHAINYVHAATLLRDDTDQGERVVGVEALDQMTGKRHQFRARLVISATGAWADGLRKQVGVHAKLRPLRGSHLIFPAWRLPVAQAISLMHPTDGRPVFIYPWEGVTLVGTTDVDHHESLNAEARITGEELDYLMRALHEQFPGLQLSVSNVLSTYAGVRPVIDTGKTDPSKEGRDHAVWQENGLLTVTGGKLTTFRQIALDTLKKAAPNFPDWKNELKAENIFSAVTPKTRDPRIDSQTWQRLLGRYGRHADTVVAQAQAGELDRIAGTETIWAELRWAAINEAVQHLEDLLLRRTRIGLLLRDGAKLEMPRIRKICQPLLGWDDARWHQEQASYEILWKQNYSVPGRATMATNTSNEHTVMESSHVE